MVVNGTGLVNGAGLDGSGGVHILLSVTYLGDKLSRVLNLRVFSLHMLFEDLGLDEISW